MVVIQVVLYINIGVVDLFDKLLFMVGVVVKLKHCLDVWLFGGKIWKIIHICGWLRMFSEVLGTML